MLHPDVKSESKIVVDFRIVGPFLVTNSRNSVIFAYTCEHKAKEFNADSFTQNSLFSSQRVANCVKIAIIVNFLLFFL